jgi:hypothetical protein
MGRFNDTVGTVNTTLRTLLMIVLVGGAAIGGYKIYEVYNEPVQKLADKQAELDSTLKDLNKANTELEATRKEVSDLSVKLAETAAQLEKVEVAMRLLKVTRRLARLTVIDQQSAPAAETPPSTDVAADTGSAESATAEQPAGDVLTRIEFVEVNEQGEPISEPRQFDIEGDMVYIDYLRVSFDDKYVEETDLDRSTAIALFQRIFGEHQEAAEGYTIDEVGTRPTAYGRGTDMSDFEKRIWSDFWTIANDKERAAELGINAAHTNAVGMRVRPGMTYEIDLRSTGDMTIRPIDPERAAINENPAPAQPPN